MMVYDNMREPSRALFMVIKKPTEALMKMSVSIVLSTVSVMYAAGWEKGHVERKVGICQKKAFCLTDHF